VTKKQKPAPIDKYELITNQICTLLEQGIKPWRKPWKAGYDNIPFQNLVTRHVYTGSNPLWCAVSNLITGHDSPFFITFKQATEQGWQVKKGSKSAWIRFAGITEKDVENEAGEITHILHQYIKTSRICHKNMRKRAQNNI
jgi:antirestriction protein ArdC